jgi:hypothetical protein
MRIILRPPDTLYEGSVFCLQGWELHNYPLTQYCIPGEQNLKQIPYSSFCLHIYSQLAVNRQTVGRMIKVLPVK